MKNKTAGSHGEEPFRPEGATLCSSRLMDKLQRMMGIASGFTTLRVKKLPAGLFFFSIEGIRRAKRGVFLSCPVLSCLVYSVSRKPGIVGYNSRKPGHHDSRKPGIVSHTRKNLHMCGLHGFLDKQLLPFERLVLQ